MPQIVIDGKRVEAGQGETIIQAAYKNKIDIPHFCWHPELSVSGNCRMCLVEVGMPKRLPDGSFAKDDNGDTVINYFPKLQIACATNVSDEMHVRTKTPKVIEAREAVMEFILINHPLDCPICDEAGQCKLQEYAFRHSNGESRFEETKNHNDKRQKWGPNVLYDAERCISCSRCIRFSKQIAGQDVLTFIQRGDHVTIKLFDETQLDNDYSMNVIDICPVGALTSPDFRFKSRVWDMSFNDSICTSCSRGCNIQVGVRNNEILRLEPRTNMYVNKYWMCDHGRLNYKNVNENRITEPLIKKDSTQIAVEWDEAYSKAFELLKKYKPAEIMFVLSPSSTNEDSYILGKFASEVIGCKNVDYFPREDKTFADDLLKTSDMSANIRGIDMLGISGKGIKAGELEKAINEGKIKALFIVDENFLTHSSIIESFTKLDTLIVNVSNRSKLSEMADVVLAGSTWAENEGSYINNDNRVQHFEPVITTKENLSRMGLKQGRLDRFGAHNDRWTHHELRGSRQAWRNLFNLARKFGVNWDYKRSGDIFKEMSGKINDFSGMTYSKLDEYQGIALGKSENPDPKLVNYESHFMKPE